MSKEESYSVEQAAEHAVRWCSEHKGWERICDIDDSDSLYKTFDELPLRVRKSWEKEYPTDPQGAWEEWGHKPCKVKYGFISGKGEFYRDILKVPRFHNLMMVFKTH